MIDREELKAKLEEGHTYKDIAEYFGTSKNTIGIIVHRMKKKGELNVTDRRCGKKKRQCKTVEDAKPVKKSDKPLKHACGELNCLSCLEKCAEYMVARFLLEHGFARVEGVGYVRI